MSTPLIVLAVVCAWACGLITGYFGALNQVIRKQRDERPVKEGTPMIDETYYDEDTLIKVRNALIEAFDGKVFLTSEAVAENCINEMLNAGILFRERLPEDVEP